MNTGNGTLDVDSIECIPSAILTQARGYALLMLSHMIRMLGDSAAIAVADRSYRSQVQILLWSSHRLNATSLQVVPGLSGDTWHLTDHHSLPMEYLILHTCEVIAFADWVWQTRLSTLLVTAISLVVEAGALTVDVRTVFNAWRKGYRRSLLARLDRRDIENAYMLACSSGCGKLDPLVLHCHQFLAWRLVHLAVMYANERDLDSIVQLWLSRVNRVKLNFTLFPLVASAHHSIHRCWRGGSNDSSAPQ